MWIWALLFTSWDILSSDGDAYCKRKEKYKKTFHSEHSLRIYLLAIVDCVTHVEKSHFLRSTIFGCFPFLFETKISAHFFLFGYYAHDRKATAAATTKHHTLNEEGSMGTLISFSIFSLSFSLYSSSLNSSMYLCICNTLGQNVFFFPTCYTKYMILFFSPKNDFFKKKLSLLI